MQLRGRHDDRVEHVDDAALVNDVVKVHEELGKRAEQHLRIQQDAELSEKNYVDELRKCPLVYIHGSSFKVV